VRLRQMFCDKNLQHGGLQVWSNEEAYRPRLHRGAERSRGSEGKRERTIMRAGSGSSGGLGCGAKLSFVCIGLGDKKMIQLATTGIKGALVSFRRVVLGKRPALFMEKMENEIAPRQGSKRGVVGCLPDDFTPQQTNI